MEKTVSYTQVKSCIGSPKDIRATLIGLGLNKLYKTVTRKDTPELRGMLHKVQHLLKLED